jgi:hypothetical protein
MKVCKISTAEASKSSIWVNIQEQTPELGPPSKKKNSYHFALFLTRVDNTCRMEEGDESSNQATSPW